MSDLQIASAPLSRIPHRPAPAADVEQIRRTIDALHDADSIIELRALHKGRKRVDAGCFDGAHRDELVREATRLNAAGAAVYVTMNELDPQLLARYANRIQEFAQATATDSNVTRRRWLLIDVDPQRPKDTSATAQQLALASEKTHSVLQYLTGLGWPAPVTAESGNGFHLLYRIDLPNDADSAELVKRCLESLAARFDDSNTKVDRSVFNAARIIKLHGTIANKGDHVDGAPWRSSRLRKIPDDVLPVSRDLLQALGAEIASDSKQAAPSHASSGLRSWTEADVNAFLARGNIAATGPEPHDGAQRWKLKECPFNPDHGPGESAVFLRSDGRLGFECRHNSCQDKHWRDLRTLVDGERGPQHRTAAHGPQQTQHPQQSSAPEPLRRPVPPPAPYPTEALGPILGSAAARINDAVKAPAAMVGQSLLAAASLAVQHLADVVVDGRREPLSLWCLTIGVSGERKSAVDRDALCGHREHERIALDAYKIEMQKHAREVQAYEAASRAASKGKDAELIAHELEKIGPPPDPPLKPLLVIGSPTIEGVHKQFIGGLPSLGLFNDDAGEFIGGHGMSPEHRVKTASGMSRLWDVGAFDRVRAGDGAEKHSGKRLALHLMLQPVIAETVLGDDVLTGQGFLARCLMTWPASTIGTRGYAEIDLTADPDVRRYWQRCRGLLAMPGSLREGTSNELEPRALTLTPDAKAQWITIHDAIEADMAERGTWAAVRAWASKAAAQILRVAGVLTLIENQNAAQIELEQIDRAAAIVDHCLKEAVRIVGTNSVPQAIRNAQALLDWVHENERTELYSGLALQLGPNCIRSAAAFDEAIGELERRGWARPMERGTVIDGRPRRKAWTVEPVR